MDVFGIQARVLQKEASSLRQSPNGRSSHSHCNIVEVVFLRYMPNAECKAQDSQKRLCVRESKAAFRKSVGLLKTGKLLTAKAQVPSEATSANWGRLSSHDLS